MKGALGCIAIVVMFATAGPVSASICALVPAFRAIDAAAMELKQRPDAQAALSLERELAALQALRRDSMPPIRLGRQIERYLAAQNALALMFHLSGPEAIQRVAARDGRSALARMVQEALEGCDHSLANGSEPDRREPLGAPSALSPDDQRRINTTHPSYKASVPGGIPLIPIGPVALIPLVVVVVLFGGAFYILLRRRRRGYARLVCFIPIELSVGASAYKTQMIELSRSGAKITTRFAIDRGAPLTISMDGETITASVIWSNASCMGVKFDTNLSALRADRLLGGSGGGFERRPATA